MPKQSTLTIAYLVYTQSREDEAMRMFSVIQKALLLDEGGHRGWMELQSEKYLKRARRLKKLRRGIVRTMVKSSNVFKCGDRALM